MSTEEFVPCAKTALRRSDPIGLLAFSTCQSSFNWNTKPRVGQGGEKKPWGEGGEGDGILETVPIQNTMFPIPQFLNERCKWWINEGAYIPPVLSPFPSPQRFPLPHRGFPLHLIQAKGPVWYESLLIFYKTVVPHWQLPSRVDWEFEVVRAKVTRPAMRRQKQICDTIKAQGYLTKPPDLLWGGGNIHNTTLTSPRASKPSSLSSNHDIATMANLFRLPSTLMASFLIAQLSR